MSWSDVAESIVEHTAEIIVVTLIIFFITTPFWFIVAIVWLVT